MKTEVAVVATGVSNTASVLAALRRIGCDPRITDLPGDVADAERVVLPGVGAFAAGMAQLRAANLIEPLQERIRDGRPTLAICLGMQLIGESSDEAPGVAGLGCFGGSATRFPANLRVPHMGWNKVTPSPESVIVPEGAAYFAHTYFRVDGCPDTAAARTIHGDTSFVSAFERGAVVALQFHPELSGAYGEEILTRWLAAERAEGGSIAC